MFRVGSSHLSREAHGRMSEMRRAAFAIFMMSLVAGSACAPKTVPPAALPSPGALTHPEFVKPVIADDLRTTEAGREAETAWAYLQSGDLKNAERVNNLSLRANPGFAAARTTAAYIALAKRDSRAVNLFSALTEANPADPSALVGKGLALQAADRDGEALEAYRAALAADPSLDDVARRVDVMTLTGLQGQLASARQAARAGRADEAIRAYEGAIAASPDSGFLYRELAAVEQQRGRTDDAVQHVRRAIDLDSSDVASYALLGQLLESRQEFEAALSAYDSAIRLEPTPDVEARRDALRARIALQALPAEYRAIETNPQVTRADLAALIGVRLQPIVDTAPVRDASVLTDVRGQWAERWIGPVARAGVIEAFANHTFQPATLIRRADLAQSVARLLNLIAVAQPERARDWVGARIQFSDLPPGHMASPAASMAVAASVMRAGSNGGFGPNDIVTGAEASAAVDAIRAIGAGRSSGDAGRR